MDLVPPEAHFKTVFLYKTMEKMQFSRASQPHGNIS